MVNRKQLTPEHKAKLHAGLRAYHMKIKSHTKEKPIRISDKELADILMRLLSE